MSEKNTNTSPLSTQVKGTGVAEVNQHLLQVNALNDIIASKSVQLSTANERVALLESALGQSQTYVDQLQAQLDQKLSQLQAANKTQQETAQQLQDRFDEVATLTGLIKQQEQQLAGLKQDKEAWEKNTSAQAQEIKALTEKTKKLQTQLTQAQTAVDEVKKSEIATRDSLNKKIQEHAKANQSQQIEIQTQVKKIAELESSVVSQKKALAQAVADLANEQGKVKKQRVEFESQLSEARAALVASKKSEVTTRDSLNKEIQESARVNKAQQVEIQTLIKKIAELESSVVHQKKALTQAAADLAAEQARVNKQRESFESQLSEVRAALVQSQQSEVMIKDALSQHIKQLTTNNESKDVEINTYKKRIVQLESSAANQDKALVDAAANLRAEQRRVQKLERQLAVQKITYQNPVDDYSKLESLLVNHRALMAKVNKTPGELELVEAHRAIIAGSDFFDAKWYLATYPDLVKAQKAVKDPARHYLLHGGLEGRNPSPKFNSEFYMAQYPDVFESGMNPLVHYLGIGQFENRYAIKPE